MNENYVPYLTGSFFILYFLHFHPFIHNVDKTKKPKTWKEIQNSFYSIFFSATSTFFIVPKIVFLIHSYLNLVTEGFQLMTSKTFSFFSLLFICVVSIRWKKLRKKIIQLYFFIYKFPIKQTWNDLTYSEPQKRNNTDTIEIPRKLIRSI